MLAATHTLTSTKEKIEASKAADLDKLSHAETKAAKATRLKTK